jgi:diguanylate cyclase (GGDEF)-like protein/PAS domain S-box-containing protein
MDKSMTTILIVDDEIRNRKLLRVLLEADGYLTVDLASGEEALAYIAQTPPQLVLLDVMMPGLDGYAVARTLKSDPSTVNIPIIMVSAQNDQGARLAGLDAGAEDFLTKPVDRAELWLRVRNLLRLKSYSDFLLNHSVILEQQVQERAADLLLFRAAMDVTADAILLVNRNTMRLIEVNATACKMFGYTRDELLQISPAELGMSSIQELESDYDEIVANHNPEALTETQMQRKNGTWMQVDVRQHAHHSDESWIIVNFIRDIAERKEVEKRLHRMAHYDALTGLPNRLLFYETLEKTLAYAVEKGWLVAVLFLDIDHFKNVNDTLGHAVGDELLRQVSDRLMQCVRIRDTVGRLGGDEFALMLVMEDNLQSAALVVNKICDVLQEPFQLHGHEVMVSASIGITVCPDDASDSETLIKYADTAMYRAKQAGRNTYRFFTTQMNIEVLTRLDLENALRKAVENNEFILHYQPKVNLISGLVVGIEALIRWRRPGYGLIPPNQFIPVLEDTGLIVTVGGWVVIEACKQIAQWNNSAIGPVQISVNVSRRQFIDGDFESEVEKALQENNIPAHLLELELTESSLMDNTARTINILQNLEKRGVHISIDDFGTGYSSLAYLQRFPVNKLKIDMAFIRDIMTNPDDAAITLAIISMAHTLKLEVIAEGVETEAQLRYLQRNHCDQIQGFYFSPPLPVLELEKILRDKKHLADPDNTNQVLLILDDDRKELSTLQKLFRPDGYQILIARSPIEAFKLLALHQVHVLLCDQPVPSENSVGFLDRVREMYPNIIRLVRSNQTDIETITNAIYSGAIHRFYPKPYTDRLRGNIRDAFRHHNLLSNSPTKSQLAKMRSTR